MKHFTFTDSLEKSAQKAVSSYLHELDSYKKFVPQNEFESIKDELISHLEEKLSSDTKILSEQEIRQVLGEIGTPRDLLQDYNLPDSTSLRNQSLFRKGIALFVFIVLSVFLAFSANIVIQQAISHQGDVFMVENDDIEKQKIMIEKHPLQKLVIRYQNSAIKTTYVYSGDNLQNNQVYIELSRAPTHDYFISYEKGTMVVTLLPRVDEVPIDYYEPEILVFLPKQKPYLFDASQTVVDPQSIHPTKPNLFDQDPSRVLTTIYFESGLTALKKELRGYDEIDMWANVLDIESQYSQIVLKPQSFSFAGWNW